MIVAHYNAGAGEALAMIHGRQYIGGFLDEVAWFELAPRALVMLRSLCGPGVSYSIKMGNRQRFGFT